jgi:amino acid adenylation domain-containing protein
VDRTPDAVAAVYDTAHLTYAALNTRANQLAHALIARGVGPDTLVALAAERSLAMLVGILSILKAGGAYVPLDPTYPAARLRFMLDDTQAPVLVTALPEAGRAPEADAAAAAFGARQVVDLHADWSQLAQESRENPPARVGGQQRAYVIYTSGSTGVPKGAMVLQRGLLNLAYGLRRFFADPAVTAVGLLTSISFDISVNQIFPTLLCGRTLHIIPEETKLNSAALLRYAQTRQLHLLDAVPSYLHTLLTSLPATHLPNALRYLLVGGEKLDRALLQRLFAQLGEQVAVVNIYGLTESSDINAFAVIPAAERAAPVTIGTPLHNNQLYILNRRGQLQPVGVAGELCIAGASLSRGYLNRPDLTAARFVPNSFLQTTDDRRQTTDDSDNDDRPFVLRPSSFVRLYKTGDLARWRADGQIEVLGRLDQQVKLRGFRIELGEVEAVLAEHPDVRAAVVAVREDAPGDARLVAYVVPADAERRRTNDESADSSFLLRPSSLANELRAFLQAKLPDYMVPSAFVALDALPLTPNGKVDRSALPALDQEWVDVAPYRPPRTPVEERVAQIWAEVLGLARVGIDDNFFALGGHSLLATQVNARLEAEFQVELPLRELFETPTLAGLAGRVEAARAAARRLRLPPLVPTPRDRRLPLSFAQQRLWLLDQLEPGSVRYNIPIIVRMIGSLDVAALRQSLDHVVQRHEALRTTFTLADGQPVQRIASASRLLVPVLDLRDEPAGHRAQHAEQLSAAEAQRPFDLASGPLLRVTLLRLDAEEHTLLLTVHHTVFDGWSTGVLVRELAACYRAATAGIPAQLPTLPIQYADYAIWQRAWLQGATEPENDEPETQNGAPIAQPQSPLQELLDYWRGALDSVSMLDLPTDRPRRAVPSGAGAELPVTLPPSLAAALSSLSRQAGATMFMTLLAAFQALLARYSGQDDIVVGTPIAGRTHPAIAPLIGCFVNPLVLRASLADNPSFLTLLARTRATCLAAYEHQDLPFEQLVDALVPAHDRGHAPLVQVFLTMQNAPLPPLALPGLALHARSGTTDSAKYDLLLDLSETADGLAGRLEYDTDLFDAATVERLVGHFQTLLAGAVADPARSMVDLPLLTEVEQRTLAGWNATQAAYPHTYCFHQLIEAQAARTPDAVALVFEGATNGERRTTRADGSDSSFVLCPSSIVQLTYAELNVRANQLAHYLRRLQVGPEVRVGICMDRSLEMVIGLLGVLKAGGAYVPLDPAYPAERLAFMLEDAQVSVLVTLTSLQDQGPGAPGDTELDALLVAVSSGLVRIVDLRADWTLIAAECAESPASGVTPDNLAYVMYTSGSTGRPKGVLVAHRGVCNSAAVEIAMLKTRPGDRVLQFFSLSFDASLFELAMTLPAGATLNLAAQETLLPGPACAELLRRQAITIYATAPSVLAALPFESFPALRTIIVLGEACGAELVARWGAGRRVFNAYGPTEATMWAVGTYIDGTRRPPIGYPIANAQVYLLDRRLQLVPVGVVGELFIGGVGLARGYHQRPDMTAERFIPNPFSDCRLQIADCRLDDPTISYRLSAIGYRLYRTGDLARYRPDGEIEYLGRGDAQVKIHGYRIELGEIEAVLNQHASVHKSVVVAREDVPGEKRLVAYVVPIADAGRATQDAGADSSFVVRPASLASELRDFLKARLPEYMLPSAFVVLDALPLTTSGKLDVRALPVPDWVHPTHDDDFAAPRTPVEEVLAGIWADVLGVAHVGIHDNFFMIGGHSLRATQTIARLRTAFQVELPLYRLFENPTVAGLAAVIAAAQAADIGRPAPPIQPVPRAAALPLSFAQQRLWFIDQMEPESPVYLLPGAIRLSGQIDLAALRQSFAAVVARHESLRTTFTTIDGRPVQVIAPALALPLPLVDLQPLPAPEREDTAARLAAREARRPFDLARGPLLRTTLVRLAPAEHVLLLTMHHIISDGWSIGVFMHDLSALYNARATHTSPALPALPIQYADYAAWQRAWLQGTSEHGDREQGVSDSASAVPNPQSPLLAQLAYWTRQLAGVPQALALPTDRPRPAIAALQGRRHALRLAPALADALAALGRRADVTLFMALLAAFQTLLARYSGQEHLLVGVPIAGRTRAETENLIGCFVNTLALRGDLSGNPSFGALLGRVRAVCLGAYAHQDLPFERLVEELQPDRDLSRAPLVQVVFALQNAPMPPMTFPAFTVEPIEIDSEMVKFDLTLTLTPVEQGLVGSLGYATELFDEATISRMVGHFQNLLEAAAAQPELALADLPLLNDAERQQLLLAWNATTVQYPPDECLHQLVEAQVARTPDAVAVAFDETNDERRKTKADDSDSSFGLRPSSPRQLTYAELDRRANQLARHLRRLGVGPERRVGICLERSIELMVAVLGVLKAGGAYVPLDPAYPADRLAFMLEDARAQVLITTNLQDTATWGDADPTIAQLPVSVSPDRRVSCVVVDLRATWGSIALELDERPLSGVTADNLAYVIYTSGSTGQPKGAMIPHRGIVNRLRWGQDAYGLTPDGCVMQKAPFSFDASIWEIFWPLSTGARLVLARPGGQQDSAYLVDLITRQQITIAHFVPSMLQFFLSEPSVETCRSLRRIFCGGEPLPGELAERCRALLAVSLYNQYGPTETSVNATFWPCDREQPRHIAAIGRPIANMQAYVLDAWLQPVPIGVAGELYLGGTGLGRGYLDRPDLTAERFVPNPFLATNDDRRTTNDEAEARPLVLRPSSFVRLYKTGDLVRYRPDGAIEFLGRIDHQVKLRGYRVELDEIAATLDRHPEVRECVVVAREEQPGDVRLVAYVVLIADERQRTKDQGADSSVVVRPSSLANELRAFLAERLPNFMVPSAFVALAALPLGPTGKVDRRALPAPDHARPGLDTPFAAPRTPTEALLAGIWAEVLGLERVGIHDNFFALGGHSLLATQAIVRMRDALRVALPLRSLFEAPTVAGLAQAVNLREEQPDNRLLKPIERVDQSEEDLIANLDRLSDAEVEALLDRLSDEGGV